MLTNEIFSTILRSLSLARSNGGPRSTKQMRFWFWGKNLLLVFVDHTTLQQLPIGERSRPRLDRLLVNYLLWNSLARQQFQFKPWLPISQLLVTCCFGGIFDRPPALSKLRRSTAGSPLNLGFDCFLTICFGIPWLNICSHSNRVSPSQKLLATVRFVVFLTGRLFCCYWDDPQQLHPQTWLIVALKHLLGNSMAPQSFKLRPWLSVSILYLRPSTVVVFAVETIRGCSNLNTIAALRKNRFHSKWLFFSVYSCAWRLFTESLGWLARLTSSNGKQKHVNSNTEPKHIDDSHHCVFKVKKWIFSCSPRPHGGRSPKCFMNYRWIMTW